MFHKAVRIAVEGDRWIFVSEQFGQRFDVHAAFECAGGEGVAQRMETAVGDM